MDIDGIAGWQRLPVEPPATPWSFPDPRTAGRDDLVAVGGDLEPGTILGAYRRGLFPMNVNRRQLGWWSPVERGIIPLDGFAPSRSLRRSRRRYRLTVDRDFRRVVVACADPRRPHGWITPAIVEAYSRLHELGWAHSVEAWTDEGDLAGALYGLRIGGLFAGESMVHFERDGSKVALRRPGRPAPPLAGPRSSTCSGRHRTSAAWAPSPSIARDYLALLGEALAQPVG